MTDSAMNARIQAHRSKLQSQLASRMDPKDFPLSLTKGEADGYTMQTMILKQSLRDFCALADQWESLPAVAASDTWMNHLTTWRKILCDELLTIKSPIRDRDIKLRSDALIWSIKFVDSGFGIAPPNLPIVDVSHMPIGVLLAKAGFSTMGDGLREGPTAWQGSIRELERAQKELDKQRAALKKQLDRVLVSAEEHAREERKFSATLATMSLKNNENGDGLVAETLDGMPLPLEQMTDEQAAAFIRFERAAFPKPEPEPVEPMLPPQEAAEP